MRYFIPSLVVGVCSVLSCLCTEATAQQQVGQGQAGQTGIASGETTGGSQNTPFGNLSGGGGSQGAARSPFGGSALGGVFGGSTGDILGAVGAATLFSQGQNRNTGGTALPRVLV